MMREPLLKVYGHVYPISDAFYADLDAACADALADDADEPVLCREEDMARVSFEGVYFPVDEVLAATAGVELERGMMAAIMRCSSHRASFSTTPATLNARYSPMTIATRPSQVTGALLHAARGVQCWTSDDGDDVPDRASGHSTWTD